MFQDEMGIADFRSISWVWRFEGGPLARRGPEILEQATIGARSSVRGSNNVVVQTVICTESNPGHNKLPGSCPRCRIPLSA